MSLPQGWAELPDGILDSIIQRLSCTSDLLAFIATCPTWRAVFMEARTSYSKLFPPLLIQSCAQLSNDDAQSEVHHTWQLMDPANSSVRFHRPVPSSSIVPPGMEFVGCSYGHAIFADLSISEMGGCFTMIDVFTGIQVSPPPCPDLVERSPFDSIDLLCCTLTAPVSSSKACLLVSTIDFYGLRVWRVGSDGWEYTRTEYGRLGCIDHIVVFEDKIIVLDCDLSLCTVHLDDPKLGVHIKPLLIVEEDNTNEMINNDVLENSRLMVCGDKLALVASPMLDYDNLVYFYLCDLDSPEGRPPRWSPAPAADLDCVVFISGAHGRLVFYDDRYGRWAVSKGNFGLYALRTSNPALGQC
jgi:hypothetical protein